MTDRPIGILDSGIGGLSVFFQVKKILPQESIIYLADSKNCPYGGKSRKEIYKFSKLLARFLIDEKAKIIVIACNTVSVTCLEKLRLDFPKVPIIGIVPVVKTAAKETKNKRIGIYSTEATSKSKYQKNLVDKFAKDCEVFIVGSKNLVSVIEDVAFKDKSIEKVLENELEPFKKANVDVIVLGCSHFVLVRKQISKIMGKKVKILDSGGAIARQIKRVLENNDIISNNKSPDYRFLTTGKIVNFKKITTRTIGKKLDNIHHAKL